MTIIEQIRYWIDTDFMDFSLTVLASLLFFDGVLPHYIDKLKDHDGEDEEDPEDLM